MANSDDNSGDEYGSKRYSSRSQKSKSILKNSYKKNDPSDDDDDQDYKNRNKYGDDDMKRYNSPINSSRSISNKPPTGRLQGLSSNNSYELSSNKKLSPINDKSLYSSKKSGKRSDDEDDDNDIYKSSKSNTKNRFNSDSNDENDKKKYNSKLKNKYNEYDDEDDSKNKNIKKKNSARDNENYSDNENSNEDAPKRSFKSSYDFDLGEKKNSKLDTTSNKLGTRNNYEDSDDIYRNKTKAPSKNVDDYFSNRKLTDSIKLEQDVHKEYEKLTKNDDFKLARSSQEKLSLKSPKATEPVSLYNRDSSYNSKAAIPLPPGLNNRATSLDRVGMYNSAYNTTNSLTSSTGKNKFNSSNNLNHLETMSDKSTGSLATNLSIREAKSRSFLVGSLSSAGGKGLLGKEELERNLTEKKARVLIVTYNMAEMKTMPEKLEELVLPDNIQTMPDIYAIGAQEFMLDPKEWEIKLQEVIGPSHVKLSSFYYGTLGLNIFIKRDLIWFCSVIDTEAINLTKVKAPLRTKASLVLSFQFFGTLMCFICSHFESGDDKLNLRIENYKTTVSNITLPKSIEIKNRQTGTTAPIKPNENNETPAEKIIDHTSNFDCVFWFGDLNFRSKKEREKVEKKVNQLKSLKSNNFEDLLNHDELYQILNNVYNPVSDKAFMNFVEPRIMFEPTYKYDINTDKYDTSEKCRIPSYCDRIVYRSKQKNTVSCSHYDSVKEIKSSDHRPVYALLEVAIRPGVDKIPLSFGDFDRDVYIAGYKKRQMYRALDVGFSSSKADLREKSKLTCQIQ